jgi:hypothetical protein
MNRGIIHLLSVIETLRVEIDISREYLHRAEDSLETGKFTKAEAMTVQAIIHLKNLLRELNDHNDPQTPISQWIL